MPHVIIEYADALESQVSRENLLNTVHQTVEQSGLFNAIDIRTRTQSFDTFRLGVAQRNFLHITIKLLAGRTDEQKLMLTQSVLQAVQSLSLTDVLVSCECLDIHKASCQQMTL
ncbi:MAG: 5-carboxymethyl-2-hydroxymuconate Delta-isomerase [Gammaproteobacteria bacterium]|nr:5-carboxymethyl-2-hydroxymuconate Delta-isomerase [Gammaproteobacteria bacterium]